MEKGRYSVCILDQLDDIMRVLGQRAHRSARDKLTVVLQWIKKAKEGYSKYLKVILKKHIQYGICHTDL